MREKRASVICFTSGGRKTAEQICGFYEDRGWECIFECRKNAGAAAGSLRSWVGSRFLDCSVIVFVSAMGIAVRSAAPFLLDKKTDPAILCVDETARFVISVVSGHIGGGNYETRLLADRLGAEAVITTATDLNGLFAVDVFAAKNKLIIDDMNAAKRISAYLLDGGTVKIESMVPVDGDLPGGVSRVEAVPPGDGRYVCVSAREDASLSLKLFPRNVFLGAGCRKGMAPERMERFLTDMLHRFSIPQSCVSCLASIDLKKEETALSEFASRRQIPFVTFTPEELMASEGKFTSSAFVMQTTGADNVCERSAVCAAGGGLLLVRKVSSDGMTAAAAVPADTLRFQENAD